MDGSTACARAQQSRGWRGRGRGGYSTIDDFTYAQEVRISHDGNVYSGPELQLQLQRFEGAGHMGFLERAGDYNAAIAAFDRPSARCRRRSSRSTACGSSPRAARST